MDKVERKLTTNEIIFFNNLSAYINTPIYFYGSIRRGDYLQGYSDIDTAIFTDNESSTIYPLLANCQKCLSTKEFAEDSATKKDIKIRI